MRTSGLANAWWARDHNTTEVVHAILARFFEIGFQTVRPRKSYQLKALCVIRWRNKPIIEPLLESLDLPLVTTDLFHGLWGIPIGP